MPEATNVRLDAVSDAVVADNLKAIAGAGAFYSGLAMAEAQAQTARMNQIGNAVVSKASDMILSYDPSQAVSEAKIMGSNTKLSEQLADLGAAVSALQEYVKAAQTTPPETGTKE
jgi:hypothetical protein